MDKLIVIFANSSHLASRVIGLCLGGTVGGRKVRGICFGTTAFVLTL